MATFRNLLKKDSSIFGKVDDFYFVTKFQNRRTEHAHDLLWIKNGPTYDVDSNTSRNQPKCNQSIYDYMRLIVVCD